MAGWRALWHLEFLGNPLGAWTLALATFLVTFTVLPLVTGFISARRRRLISHGPPGVHFAIDLAALLIERSSRVFLWAVAVWLGSRHLTLAPRLERWLTIALVLLFWMQAALWAMRAVRYAIDVRRQRSSAVAQSAGAPAAATAASSGGRSARCTSLPGASTDSRRHRFTSSRTLPGQS